MDKKDDDDNNDDNANNENKNHGSDEYTNTNDYVNSILILMITVI